jgi:hypothetical protein
MKEFNQFLKRGFSFLAGACFANFINHSDGPNLAIFLMALVLLAVGNAYIK